MYGVLYTLSSLSDGEELSVDPVSPFLFQTLEQNTLLWILLSSLVGAVIGGGINFFFTNLLAVSVEKSRKTRSLVKRYSLPLLLAAEKLDRRMENFIRFSRNSWMHNPDDDYYKISTLYLFGSYFSWCHALESKTFDFYSANRTIKKFNINFYRVYRGISSFEYLKEVEQWSLEELDLATVPRLVLQAMGEVMLDSEGCENGGLPRIIDYSRFSKEFYDSEEKSRWFHYILGILTDIQKSPDNPAWNRLVVFAIYLRIFVRYLDPRSRYTARKKVDTLHLLHPVVAKRVEENLIKAGYADVIDYSASYSS